MQTIIWFQKKNACLLGAALLLLPFITAEGIQYYWYSKAIPEKICITYPVSIETDGGFREGCGTLVFKVSDDTLELIKKDGIEFLSDAIQGRGHPGDRYYRYAQWKQTPLPPAWTSEGTWMICSGLSHIEHSKILAATKSGGAYYTTTHETQLVLLPSLGYLVFSFFG